MNTFLFEQFLTTQIGDAFRLFPFGKVVKNGKAHEITPEMARMFKLPHFKPPIKLGSHEETTAAGGHIVGLEVRDDGLYAIPEWNERGLQALKDGAYRYHSPEVIFDEGGLENPDGGWITAPLILGDALLHTPHLGEAAAMYSVQPIDKKEGTKMAEVELVPESVWEKFTAFIDSRIHKAEPEKVEVVPEDYEATKLQAEEYRAKLEAIERENKLNERIAKFGAELKQTKADTELAGMLAGLPDETAEAIMRQLRALSEQIKESADAPLTEEVGIEGQPIEDPKAAFNALVLKYAAEKRVGYNQAFDVVKAEHADLFSQWANK